MKKGWPTRRLGDLFVFKNGRAFKKEEWTTSGLPIIRIQNLNNADAPFNFFAGEYSPDILVEPGDLLFSWSGTVGSSFGSHLWHGEAGVLNQHIFKIGLRSTIAKRYAFHALRHITEEIERSVNGAVGLVHITKEKLNEFTLPVPPLPEQQRVVDILDEAFEGITTAKANTEKNLQNARALFESHLQSVFTQRGKGWVDSAIGEEIRFIDYRGKTPLKTASGIRLITAKNVKMGHLQVTPMEFIAAASYKGWMTRGIPQKGDVLFTTEAPLANVAQLDTDEKVAFAQRIIIMQPNAAKLDSTFLKYLLLSQPVRQRIRTKGTGATVQGIKASLLKTIEISFPKSLAEQEKIVEKLDGLNEETQRLANLYGRKLTALEALKKSLLHQAFTGEL